MFSRLLLIASMGIMLSGCFMAPLALVAPAASGFSTASLVQTGVSAGVNYMVEKSTGKSVTEHALDTLTYDILKQSYTFEPTKVLNKIK